MKRFHVSSRYVLLFFILMNFVLSMSATVFNGILDIVSVSMNTSVADVGLLNTTYAFGAALGVPITLILFRKIERTSMLKIMLSLTIMSTFLLIYAQDFSQLLVIRFITGVAGNSYAVLATATVAAISPKERLGRSLAMLIMGNSLALVVGIPATRALSSVFAWQSIFWLLNILSMLALVYFILALHKSETRPIPLNLLHELSYLKDKQALTIIISSLLIFIGSGAFYTYITPYLIGLSSSIEPLMSLILMVLGIASFLGNLLGGHVSDRIGYKLSLLRGTFTQLLLVVLLIVTQRFVWANVILSILWLMNLWFLGLQLNAGMTQATENKSSFMLSMNSSAIQLGGAIGSSIGAIVILNSSIHQIIFVTLLTSLLVFSLQWLTRQK